MYKRQAENEAIAETAISILEESRPEILQYLPASPLPFDPIIVYLYPSSETFLNTLRLTGLDWIVGKASPEIGVLMVPISNPETAEADLRQRLPHELAHLLLYRSAGDGYERFPAWMDEGFATQFEEPVNPNYAISIANVNNSTQLIPFGQMCVNLPVDPPEISLRGYAQSHAVVQFMLEKDGGAIAKIIMAAQNGAMCEEAVVEAMEKDGDQLAQEWLNSIRPQFPDPRSPLWVAIGLIFFSFVFIILVLWGRTGNNRTIGEYNG